MHETRDQASALRREAEAAGYPQRHDYLARERAAEFNRRIRPRRPSVVPTLLVWLWRLCVTAWLAWLTYR